MGHRTGSLRALVVAFGLVLAGCSSAAEPTAAPEPPGPVEEPQADAEPEPQPEPEPDPEAEPVADSLVATAVVDTVEVFAEPADGAERTHELAHPTDVGAPRVFLVEDRPGDGWLEVLLPVRPNGSTGWIREADVELTRNPYRIEIALGDFSLTVHRGDEVALETTIGYGDADTPTPGGRYYLIELLQPPDPDGAYGPFAFGLSGFSDVLTDFAGGEGVIGIHGTNQPDSIGSTVSAGCIRIANDVISELATFLPLGTPVTIDA